MAKRRFEVTVTQVVEIDDAVFARVNEADWRAAFYDLSDDAAVAAHVGGNLVRGWQFGQLDGFGGLPADAATRDDGDWDAEALEVTAVGRRRPEEPR